MSLLRVLVLLLLLVAPATEPASQPRPTSAPFAMMTTAVIADTRGDPQWTACVTLLQKQFAQERRDFQIASDKAGAGALGDRPLADAAQPASIVLRRKLAALAQAQVVLLLSVEPLAEPQMNVVV